MQLVVTIDSDQYWLFLQMTKVVHACLLIDPLTADTSKLVQQQKGGGCIGGLRIGDYPELHIKGAIQGLQ